jgi:hypothetical protein
MASRDLHNNIKRVLGLAPVVVTDNTAQNTAIIDTAGYESCEFIILTGTLADADATFAVTLTAGDDSGLSDGAAVTSATDLLGTLAAASFTFADDSTTKRIGYRGSKRYVKLTITPSNNTGNAPLAVLAELGHPRHAPVA